MSKTQTAPTRSLAGTIDSSLRAVLVEAVDGPARGARLLLEAGAARVGKSKSCDLRLDDDAVSREHARLELLPGAVRVTDLGSRNGTRYLGAKIREARVPIGGSVQVGKTTLRLSDAAQPARPASDRDELCGLLGRSPAMRQLFAAIERAAASDATVLITGETGTGKELVARALHALSARRGEPFAVFDCAAVSGGLIESALFGHVKGAFTGADQARAGTVEQARSGTLFLDEIGELQLGLQPKLLRLLEQGELRRVGEDKVRKSSARIVAATHRDLESAAKAGGFRSDLFFRLAQVQLWVPPLRERAEDIPMLAAAFARQVRGVEVKLGAATLAALQCDPWPGNVRELRNAVERVVRLDVPVAGPVPSRDEAPRGPYHEAREKLLVRFERDYLKSLLEHHGGTVAAAAKEAGLSRSQFYRLCERHGIELKGKSNGER